MLSQKAIQEFKNIWKQENGADISDDFANRRGRKLLEIFDEIYRPVKKDWFEKTTIQVVNLDKGKQDKSSYKNSQP